MCIRGSTFLFLSFVSTRENMRIKIIGDNNCARATRHLLRMAGFAVTEFLSADVVTEAPHSGFAITIEISSLRAPGGAANSLPQAPGGVAAASLRAPGGASTGLAPAHLPLMPCEAAKGAQTKV